MDQKQQAENLFLNTEKSQKEIAEQIGISPRTLYRWIQQGRWQELKSATRRMPSVLVKNIYSQLDDINYGIAKRERGERHPTKDESLTINRLMNCIGKVQKQTSQGQNIQFMMNFIDYVRPLNDDLAKLLTHYGSAFLNGSQIKGFHPYDIEYNNTTQSAEEAPSLFLGKACPELVSGVSEGRKGELAQDFNPNQLELPFPDQNICDTTPLSFGEGRGEASFGHESDIPNHTKNLTQQTENQTQTPGTHTPKMSENIFPEDWTHQEAPVSNNVTLSGACPATSGREGRGEASLAQNSMPDPIPQPTESDNGHPPYYYRKCIQDPNDPYTFYYDKITRRTMNSPKYGKPPDGFREVPKKDCLDRDYYGKGFGRYNWL